MTLNGSAPILSGKSKNLPALFVLRQEQGGTKYFSEERNNVRPLWRKDSEIENMTATIVDGNPYFEDALRKDRMNRIVGFTLLLIGFGLQVISILIQIILPSS